MLLVPPDWWPCATWNVGVVPTFSKRFRTIIYDGRGTGRSGKPAEGYSVRQFALDGIELYSSSAYAVATRSDLQSGGRLFKQWRSSGRTWSRV